MAKPRKRCHKVVVEIVASCPVSEKDAIIALTRILTDQNCFRRSFIIQQKFSPRYHIRSWLKSFAYAAGKYKEEGQLL